MNWKGGDCNKITHKANKLYAFQMGQLGHAEWVPPHTQQGGSSLQWGARGQGGGNRRWRASQAKKVGRVFFRGLHHWGRRAGQVRGFSISYFLFVLSGGRVRRCQGEQSRQASTWGCRYQIVFCIVCWQKKSTWAVGHPQLDHLKFNIPDIGWTLLLIFGFLHWSSIVYISHKQDHQRWRYNTVNNLERFE